jgi:ArsR family transcriptional regulator
MTPHTDLASLFRALSDPTRLRLLNLLGGGEICVCYFVAVIGTSQPKVSRHLAYLRKARVVVARRKGKWMYYRLADPSASELPGLVRRFLSELHREPQMQSDLARLRDLTKRTNGRPSALQPIAGLPNL